MRGGGTMCPHLYKSAVFAKKCLDKGEYYWLTFHIDHIQMFWYIIWGPTSYGAPVTGPQSRKMPILAKYKMAAGDQIVHLTKKIIKQKSSDSMSFWRSTSTLGCSDQIYGSYGQKMILAIFSTFKLPIYW